MKRGEIWLAALDPSEGHEQKGGEFYQADLLGCEVVDGTGRLRGLVEDWLETGAAPLIQVRTSQNKELPISRRSVLWPTSRKAWKT
jgi:ribosomal 30S subunit maturation factor RimM